MGTETQIRRCDDPFHRFTVSPQVIVMRASVPQVGAVFLLLGLFPSVLGRLMMTDDAASAESAVVMPDIVPGGSANSGALQEAYDKTKTTWVSAAR
jgi:hypothetical protein